MDFSIHENETERQYIWRVGKYVLEGKITWKELANIINEKWRNSEDEYRDESSYRKPYQSASSYYEDVFSKMIGNEYSDNIAEQKRELEKERQKLYATKIEYTRSIRQQSRFELFYENVAKELKTIEPPKFIVGEIKSNNKCSVLTFCDIHAGAVFKNNTNSYSFSEITHRFQRLLDYTKNYICNNHVSDMKVIGLGDDITGILRLTDLQLNESSVVQATVFIAQTIASFLNELSAFCNIQYYHVPTSNHSQIRPLGTKASELANEDVEYIIGNYIKDVLVDNKNISVFTNFGHDYIEIPIFDFNVLATHGHRIKNIQDYVKDISFKNKKFYDTVFVAHFHSGKEIIVGEGKDNDIEILVCPSFIGTCPYADSLLVSAKAACKIFVFDEKYGHTETHKIILN